MTNNKNQLSMLVLALVFGMVVAGTVNAQATIHGAWENGRDVIYFSEGGIFVLYNNGNFVIDGSYTLNPGTRNQPQSIVFDFGVFDRMDSEFNIRISANSLVFETKRPNQFGDSIAVPGTYRRSSFVLADSQNPLIGTWKSGTLIFRFYRGDDGGFGNHPRDGGGTLFGYRNEPVFTEWRSLSITYQFTNTSRMNGNITFWGFNENWSYGVVNVVPFIINGNILRVEVEGVTVEFIRQ